MPSLNRATLIGHVGQDPEARYTQDGKSIAYFSLATTERWKDRDGERRERTEWHRITAFGKTAEFCLEYIAKGRLLFVEGRIQTDDWEDREGNTRRTTKIIADRVQPLDNPDRDDRPRRDTSNQRREGYTRPRQTGGTTEREIPEQEEAPF